jgi:hypothetical protein
MTEYDFRTLSPTDFEYLICDLLNEDCGWRLRSYPEGRDQGIDLREQSAGGDITIVQCKHYLKSGRSAFLRAVEKEKTKPAWRDADRYVFVTSYDLTTGLEREVADKLDIPLRDVWGPRAINEALGRNEHVERRHFKLWLASSVVLDSIVKAGLWRRSDALLADTAQQAKYWVEPPAYREVQDTLDREGVCVVSGSPGVGKTFLANMVMLSAARDGWEVVDISGGPDEAWHALRPATRQLFYWDDFLGQARLSPTAENEAPMLLRFASVIRGDRGRKRLIVTSRDQVLGQAASAVSDPLRQLALDPARCRIVLSAYEPELRTEILANHLYFSDLPESDREKLEIDSRMLSIGRHPSYNLRLIDVITSRPLASSTMDRVLDDILHAFSHPEAVWDVSFEALSDLARETVLTLATLPLRPIPHERLRTLVPKQCGAREWKAALRSLEPSCTTFAFRVVGDHLVVGSG